MMKQSKLIPILFCLSLLFAYRLPADAISVTGPWIREAPAGARALGAFMTISNHSSHALTLESISSPDFTMIQIHLTRMHEGMAHMFKQSNLLIPSGKSVTLEPGGYHLMLMHPVRALKSGDPVKLQLHFDNGEVIDISADVRKEQP